MNIKQHKWSKDLVKKALQNKRQYLQIARMIEKKKQRKGKTEKQMCVSESKKYGTFMNFVKFFVSLKFATLGEYKQFCLIYTR